ncbi:MAG: hypothetical protein SGJ13_01925, partial [Actinomycetota bacterium]|nr:hypothetical protein [Actinomycetota bacterium]
LDIQIVADAERYDEFLADWPVWLAEIAPTVFARTPIVPFIVNVVTADGLTLDILVGRGQAIDFTQPAEYVVGALSGVRFTDVSLALEYAVAEHLRGIAGPFISLVQRGEHLRHMTGVPHLLGLLTTVFLAELDAPAPRKHWSRTYTDEQLAAVAALPPVRATREDLIAFGLGLSELLMSRARPLYPDFGLEWPHDFARVAADRVRDVLGIETSDWLY